MDNQPVRALPSRKNFFDYSDNFHIKDSSIDTSVHALPDGMSSSFSGGWEKKQTASPFPDPWEKKPASPYPEHWNNKQDTSPLHRIVLPSLPKARGMPSLTSIVGGIAIIACCAYTVLVIFCQLCRAFPQAIR